MQELIPNIDLNPKATVTKRVIAIVLCVLFVAILAVAAALLIKFYVVSTFIVDGISMYPTLDGGGGAETESGDEASRVNGEVLYLNKLAKIKRGDIVVFNPDWGGLIDENGESRSLVKRVVAIGGDKISIVSGMVYLNGEPLEEPYVNPDEPRVDFDMDEITVPDGYIFCMGDNRNHSTDCRLYGPVSLKTVIGRCFLIKGLDGKLRRP